MPGPLLSICVPTHDGRRETLAALLDSVVAEAAHVPGLIELCIGDNASADGTAELVAALSADAPFPVAYVRHETNTGLASNLMSAVALARGDYCWLLGSDDLLAPGALGRACALLRLLPGTPGYAVGAIHVDAAEPALRSRALPRAFHPAGETPRIINGLDAVYEECGNSWCALSWSIVEREAWESAVRRHRKLALAHPVFPQVVLLAAIAAEHPCWGWLGAPLVRQRNATTFLFERGQAPIADRWSVILSGAAAAWAAALGSRGGRRWRARMRRLHRVWGGVADVRATKLYDQPSVRSQARLARACFTAFWASPQYWRGVLQASLAPVWLTRRLHGTDRGRSQPPASLPRPEDLAISAPVPSRLCAGDVVEVALELHNRGRRIVRGAGPGAITIGQRWFDASGHPLSEVELMLNEIAMLPQELGRSVLPFGRVRTSIALYAPPGCGVYTVVLAAHLHGVGWLDEAHPALRVGGEVEVFPRAAAACGLRPAR